MLIYLLFAATLLFYQQDVYALSSPVFVSDPIHFYSQNRDPHSVDLNVGDGPIKGYRYKKNETGQWTAVESDTIRLDEPFLMRAQCTHAIGSKGGMPTWMIKIKSIESKKKDRMQWSAACEQPNYCQSQRQSQLLEGNVFEFEWIPTSEHMDYESHLEYIPHLNILQWMQTLPEGQYQLDLQLGKKKVLAKGRFILMISNDGRSKLWELFEALYYAKVNKVTFPVQSCQNKMNSIENLEELSHYGKIIKLDYEVQASNVIDWSDPGRSEDFIYATGYGIFDRFGRYELIPLKFRKVNEDDAFSYFGLGEYDFDLNFKCDGTSGITPRLLRYGFEMKKHNIYNCLPW